MVVKKAVWGNVISRCPHCNGRLRVYVREEVVVTKRSGYITHPIKKKAKKKSKR